MTKFYATVTKLFTRTILTSLCMLLACSTVLANDNALGLSLETKQIVRVKLWYDGIGQNDSKVEQNRDLTNPSKQDYMPIHLKEELRLALDKVKF